MKVIILLLLTVFICLNSVAQPRSDSLAYQLQRKKINNMLALRKQKFGQYSQSLSKHTGIFGLQTKKDIRRSNEILMDIANADDEIFRQLKILLDYRAFEQTQVQTRSVQVENSTLGYMNTINKLRDQLDKAKTEAQQQQKDHQRLTTILSVAAFILIALVLILIIQISRLRAKVQQGNATKNMT